MGCVRSITLDHDTRIRAHTEHAISRQSTLPDGVTLANGEHRRFLFQTSARFGSVPLLCTLCVCSSSFSCPLSLRPASRHTPTGPLRAPRPLLSPLSRISWTMRLQESINSLGGPRYVLCGCGTAQCSQCVHVLVCQWQCQWQRKNTSNHPLPSSSPGASARPWYVASMGGCCGWGWPVWLWSGEGWGE